mgnify:CR=1 FL=1
MLTKKTAEAAYADFLTQTNYKRLPKTAGALFTQLEKQLRTIDETENDGPAIAAAFFRMVKAVNRKRELLSEFYGLLAALAVVCENGTEGDIRLLRVLASLRTHKQEVAR